MDKQDLLDLKEDIEEAKKKASQLSGKLELLQAQLKKEWGCSTIEQADAKLIKMERDAEALSIQIKEGIAKLNADYDLKYTHYRT